MSEPKYWWCRVFTFIDNDTTLPIKEFYVVAATLDECKRKIVDGSKTQIKFWSKPRNSKEDYIKIMESSSYYYDRYVEMQQPLHEYCYICHSPIDGDRKHYQHLKVYGFGASSNEYRYFCSNECKNEYNQKKKTLISDTEQWQSRTSIYGVIGYVYHIYNKATHKHYIGQTKYMPFFRWQEHIKQNEKGHIEDLMFETLCEVRGIDSELLNKAEGYYINQYIEKFGKDYVMNGTIPKFDLKQLEIDYMSIISGTEKPSNNQNIEKENKYD